MHFEVNGQRYFLNFEASEGRWELLTGTARGIRRVKIEDDNGPLIAGVATVVNDASKRTIN